MLQSLNHSLQRASAPVDAESHCPIFMPSDTLYQRVLHPSVSQVINQRMSEAVERLPSISDAQLRFVPTEPLRWGVAQLPSHCI